MPIYVKRYSKSLLAPERLSIILCSLRDMGHKTRMADNPLIKIPSLEKQRVNNHKAVNKSLNFHRITHLLKKMFLL